MSLACTHDSGSTRTGGREDSADAVAVDTAPLVSRPIPLDSQKTSRGPESRLARLSPLADTISSFLVFAPVGERWFLAASRNRRLLLDIGRVDTEVRRDSAHALAYRQAVERRSPVPLGTRFRLRGTWGAEDVTATAVDSWNGRIVLRLKGSASLDTLARGKAILLASAYRTDSVASLAPDSCDRVSPLPVGLATRVTAIRDSIAESLRKGPQPPYQRLRAKMVAGSSQLIGCFGTSRVLLAVHLRGGNVEWVRERLVLVDTLGAITSLRVSDFRFRAHELLVAYDADGDGVDDIVTRATTERAGATTILVLDVKARRLRRFLAGFAWEDQ